MRRKGHYIAGGLMLSALIGLTVLGANVNTSSNISLRYYQYMAESGFSKTTESSEDSSQADSINEQDLYAQFFGIDKLNLGFETKFGALDGICYSYFAEFSVKVDDNTVKTLKEEITRKCGQLSEDNYYGEITVDIAADNVIRIDLDLSKTYEEKAVTGILKALKDTGNVTKVAINDP